MKNQKISIMKRYFSTLIFYSDTSEESDTSEIDKVRRFVRREHLPVIADKCEYNLNKLFISEKFLPGLPPVSADSSPQLFEHQYFVTVSSGNLMKLHTLVSLLQSYAAYIGIRSRIYAMELLK